MKNETKENLGFPEKKFSRNTYFTKAEDEKLIELFQQYHKNWIQIG